MPPPPVARRTVYLAGPEVFLPDARAIGDAKKDVCRRHGLDALFPLDDAPVPGLTPDGLASPSSTSARR